MISIIAFIVALSTTSSKNPFKSTLLLLITGLMCVISLHIPIQYNESSEEHSLSMTNDSTYYEKFANHYNVKVEKDSVITLDRWSTEIINSDDNKLIVIEREIDITVLNLFAFSGDKPNIEYKVLTKKNTKL